MALIEKFPFCEEWFAICATALEESLAPKRRLARLAKALVKSDKRCKVFLAVLCKRWLVQLVWELAKPMPKNVTNAAAMAVCASNNPLLSTFQQEFPMVKQFPCKVKVKQASAVQTMAIFL